MKMTRQGLKWGSLIFHGNLIKYCSKWSPSKCPNFVFILSKLVWNFISSMPWNFKNILFSKAGSNQG
ncbi:hypothetical protein EUGRSUZ_F03121 [Eucalyptus grandis]|uniref:Uncharacterized protein n=2 Tax=Eucalyptus grandis TaxID=71139 RepID=A0ACC3KKE1_EUCGR|nr:hypothetical protein EUGRSUZ_F03121 [Eucalyptus grandis]